MRRREFLRAAGSGPLIAALPPALRAQSAAAPMPAGDWDSGVVKHLLPTVSDTAILLTASLSSPLESPPVLRVGPMAVRGRPADTRGEHWTFLAQGLSPQRQYRLQLLGDRGQALCEPWDLTTFPAPDTLPSRVRVLFYTCAGGHEALGFLPVSTRHRLLRRAMAFAPDAVIANGDHVYWDLRSPLTAARSGASARAREITGGQFDRADVVFGSDNETLLKRAAGPQIVPVYGNLLRSTPVFFIQDDHDYFDNDDADDRIVTFPPDFFMTEMARATQSMYYPAFLPDRHRPRGLPGATAAVDGMSLSESFGTLRYGRLVEMLLYSTRRGMTLAGQSAVFLDPEVERWLVRRMADRDAIHVVNAPSNPPGWTAGKWGEWYADVLGPDRRLTTALAKPYWQPGWRAQHDRLLAAMSGMRGRVPLSVSGDLHAIAIGHIHRSARLDLSANPVVSVLSGPMGTSPQGWPSSVRKVGALPPLDLSVDELIQPIEQHGFTLADFTPDGIKLQFFRWDVNAQPVAAIDTLEPFKVVDLPRPA